MPCTGSTSMLRNVARRGGEILVDLRAVDDQRVVEAELAECRLKRLRLGFLGVRLVEDDEARGLGLGGQRVRRPSARTFLGRSIAWLRGRGPNALPPPTKMPARREP